MYELIKILIGLNGGPEKGKIVDVESPRIVYSRQIKYFVTEDDTIFTKNAQVLT